MLRKKGCDNLYGKNPLWGNFCKVPLKGPTRGSGEPPEGRTQGGTHKLRINTTMQSTAKGRTQREMIHVV